MTGRLLMALTMKLGNPTPQGSGEYAFECPQSGCKSDGKKKFGVNLKSMKFNCFRCHHGGLVLDLLEQLGIDRSMVVVRTRPEKASVEVPVPSQIPGFRPFEFDQYPDSITERGILDMCFNRGKLSYRQICKRGWGRSSESWLSGRLIVPIYMDGDLVQYLARAAFSYMEPKEKSGPEAQGWVAKEKILDGVGDVKSGAHVVLVEGMWDKEAVRRMYPSGTPVSTVGTNLGEYAIGALLRQDPGRVTIFYDGDKAGRDASVRAASKLRKRYRGPLYIGHCPLGQDPDDLDADQMATAIELGMRVL